MRWAGDGRSEPGAINEDPHSTDPAHLGGETCEVGELV